MTSITYRSAAFSHLTVWDGPAGQSILWAVFKTEKGEELNISLSPAAAVGMGDAADQAYACISNTGRPAGSKKFYPAARQPAQQPKPKPAPAPEEQQTTESLFRPLPAGKEQVAGPLPQHLAPPAGPAQPKELFAYFAEAGKDPAKDQWAERNSGGTWLAINSRGRFIIAFSAKDMAAARKKHMFTGFLGGPRCADFEQAWFTMAAAPLRQRPRLVGKL